MGTTKALLALLTEAYPPPNGCRHSVVLNDETLLVVIATDTKFRDFALVDDDLSRSAGDLAADIKLLMGALA